MLYHLTLAVVQTPLAAKRLSSWIARTNKTYSGRTFRLIGTSKWIYCSSSRWAARCSLNFKVSALDGLFVATPEKNPTLHKRCRLIEIPSELKQIFSAIISNKRPWVPHQGPWACSRKYLKIFAQFRQRFHRWYEGIISSPKCLTIVLYRS